MKKPYCTEKSQWIPQEISYSLRVTPRSEHNQVLLLMDMSFTERKNILTKMHEVKFKSTKKVVDA